MGKFLLIILGFVLLYVISMAVFGARIHPENFPYYFQKSGSDVRSASQVTFANGTSAAAEVVDQTQDSVTLHMEGATVLFKRNEIQDIQPLQKGVQAFDFSRNFQRYGKKYPLVTFRPEDTLMAAWDRFAMEPSRIAEQMRKNNPQSSLSAQMDQALQLAGQAQAQAARQQALMEAEIREAEGGPSQPQEEGTVAKGFLE